MSMYSNDLTNKNTKVTSSSYHSGRYDYIVNKCFDDHVGTTTWDGFQINTPSDSDWIQVEFDKEYKPSRISIQGNDDLALPKSLVIKMSNNNQEYEYIDTIDNIKNTNDVQYYKFKKPDKKYKYMRLYFKDSKDITICQINQIEIFESIDNTLSIINSDNKFYSLNKDHFKDGHFEPLKINDISNISDNSFKSTLCVSDDAYNIDYANTKINTLDLFKDKFKILIYKKNEI